MKTLLRTLLFTIIFLIWAGFALSAETVAPAAPTFAQWIRQTDVIVMLLGIALAISEFLGASPWLKGNGILDTIVKFLRWIKESQEAKQ